MRQDDETDQQEQICTCRESRHRCTCFAAYKAQVVLIEKENKQTIWVRMVFGVQKNEAKGKEHYHCLPKSAGTCPKSQTLPHEKKIAYSTATQSCGIRIQLRAVGR